MMYEEIPAWERLMVKLFGRNVVNAHGVIFGRMWCGKMYFRISG